MNKEEIARKRNWLKYRLKGLYFNANESKGLTSMEMIKLKKIMDLKEELLNDLYINDAFFGIKHHVRCWCGKVANHVTIQHGVEIPVCKQHKD